MVSPVVKTLILVGLGGGALYLATRPKDEAQAEEAASSDWGSGGGDYAMSLPPGDQLLDSDGDGVPDVYDVFPHDPARTGYEQPADPTRSDRDADGIQDAFDPSPDDARRTGFETQKASFFDTGAGQIVGNVVGFGALGAAGTLLSRRLAKAPAPAGAPAPTSAGSRLSQLRSAGSRALTRVTGIQPAAANATRKVRLARGAGRAATAIYVAEGVYVGARNVWDTGKAVVQAASGDRDAALRGSSRAVQRGTQFLTLGSVNLNLRKQKLKVFGRKVASW